MTCQRGRKKGEVSKGEGGKRKEKKVLLMVVEGESEVCSCPVSRGDSKDDLQDKDEKCDMKYIMFVADLVTAGMIASLPIPVPVRDEESDWGGGLSGTVVSSRYSV